MKTKEFYNLLKESLPNRFMNLKPYRFEEFICELFKDMGYIVEETPKTGDYGADLIAEKNNERIAVQVKRFKSKNLVGVHLINQVIGAKKFYNCNKAHIITTSDFSGRGRKLCEVTNTTAWSWDNLYTKIKENYLEDKDIYTFCKDKGFISENKPGGNMTKGGFEFWIQRVKADMFLSVNGTTDVPDRSFKGHIVTMKMKNITDILQHNISVTGVYFFDILDNQFEHDVFMQGSFLNGDIYPSSSVEIQYCISADKIADARNIKAIVLKYFKENNPFDVKITIDPNMVEYILQNSEETTGKSKCFIATATYGSELAEEVKVLSKFRDLYLCKAIVGRWFIRNYCRFSPAIASVISDNCHLKKMVRLILCPIVKLVKFIIHWKI